MELVEQYKQEIQEFCKTHNIKRLSVFGSRARGTNTDRSDIDFLVRFSEPVSLFELARIERKLSELLDQNVDLVTEEALHKYIKSNIKNELTVIYESAA